ncbi:hypothetical protein Cantr_04260 [Candida viswanathii]|uniref:Uncharacterized protein n=1 Tax=Candida viswanathii TaxID=5486 RepID=A0A367XPW7_9ASCO|nr:hypothetical protein Cantr_04260 [Candida viswanathii]
MSNHPQTDASYLRYKSKEKTLDHKSYTVSKENLPGATTTTLNPASFLPPLPPLPQTTHSSENNILIAPQMTQATLTRLEVESTSSKSLPISFPYYFLDQEDPQDTFHLWRSDDDSQKKLDKDKDLPMPPPKQAAATTGNYDDFNPKRFSNFIVDEQNPYVSQRLDNLSIVSPSLESAGYEIIRSLTPMQRNPKNSGLILNPDRHLGPGSSEVLNQQHPHREISDSMGSQATIFSTRQEMQDTPLLTRNEYNRKRASLLFKRKSKRTSNVRVQTSSSSNSSLARKNAIKSKQGSWIYRLKMSIKKMISKFKFWSFKVSSKRTASVRRSRTLQSLRRKRENPRPKDIKRIKSIRDSSSPFNISAPITNPHLGKQPVFKVAKIDDNLKFRAGAPKENVYLHDNDESFGKLNHLSEYIYQQEADYFKKHGVNLAQGNHNGDRNSDSKSMLPSPDFEGSPSELLTDSVTTHARTMPPVPPPHLDHTFTNTRNPSPQRVPAPQVTPPDKQQHPRQPSQQEMVELWEKYLRLVLYKRIQLRQEINMFQNFMVSEFTPGSGNKRQGSQKTVTNQSHSQQKGHQAQKSIANSSSNNGSSIYADSNTLELIKSMEGEKSIVKSESSGVHTSTNSESRSGDSASVYTSSSGESHYVRDEKDEEFNTRVLHRRSMLGDMLEYLSEEDDEDDDEDEDEYLYVDGSSVNKSNSIASKQSDILLKTYGTVVKKSNSRLNSPLKRSFGLNHSLSSIANES